MVAPDDLHEECVKRIPADMHEVLFAFDMMGGPQGRRALLA